MCVIVPFSLAAGAATPGRVEKEKEREECKWGVACTACYSSLCLPISEPSQNTKQDITHKKETTSIQELRKLMLHVQISSQANVMHTLIMILFSDVYPGWVSPSLFVSVSY